MGYFTKDTIDTGRTHANGRINPLKSNAKIRLKVSMIPAAAKIAKTGAAGARYLKLTAKITSPAIIEKT